MANELSPALEKKYTQDLLATRRRIDLLETEKSEVSKLLKEPIEEEWSRERVLRDLLEGRISEQIALPGIEEPGGERAQKIGQLLRRAVETVSTVCHVDAEVDPDRPELRPFPEDEPPPPRKRGRHG